MRRLKIYEQLLIVFFLTVITPLCIVTLIVINVNQQAIRKELETSAYIITDGVYQRITSSIEEKNHLNSNIIKSLKYINSKKDRNALLYTISKNTDSSVELLNKNEITPSKDATWDYNLNDNQIYHSKKSDNLIIFSKFNNQYTIKQTIKFKTLENSIFNYLIDDERQVYVLDSENNVIMSHNFNNTDFKNELRSFLLKDRNNDESPHIFGEVKNRPNVYFKLKNPNWTIIVLTPKNLTKESIINARYKIINALLISAISTIIMGILYSLSLKRNIRQLFKGIIAIGKGNYRRKIRLISDFFTPYELIFLGDEFNNMIQKIENSYSILQEANIKLSKVDKIKSNLIDTVSHEFRTPLTCIKGHSSRLITNKNKVDEETQIKSLKIIKQQTERLSRLVEDLLVIPDIESSGLRIFPDYVNLKEMIELCIISIHQKQQRVISFTIEESANIIFADPDRVEQIVMNLIDNAMKYSHSDSDIKINAYTQDSMTLVEVHNSCDPIPESSINLLFEKFSRLEDNLTRTTRGTGLGLFITKGLINSMGGNINVSVDNGFTIKFSLPQKGE